MRQEKSLQFRRASSTSKKHIGEEACQTLDHLVRAGSHVHQAGNPCHEAVGSHDHWEDNLVEESNMDSLVHVAEVHSLCLLLLDILEHDTLHNHAHWGNLARVSPIDIPNRIYNIQFRSTAVTAKIYNYMYATRWVAVCLWTHYNKEHAVPLRVTLKPELIKQYTCFQFLKSVTDCVMWSAVERVTPWRATLKFVILCIRNLKFRRNLGFIVGL